jgi:hypothetical protein
MSRLPHSRRKLSFHRANVTTDDSDLQRWRRQRGPGMGWPQPVELTSNPLSSVHITHSVKGISPHPRFSVCPQNSSSRSSSVRSSWTTTTTATKTNTEKAAHHHRKTAKRCWYWLRFVTNSDTLESLPPAFGAPSISPYPPSPKSSSNDAIMTHTLSPGLGLPTRGK